MSYRVRTFGGDAERAPQDFDADSFIAEAVKTLAAAGVRGVTSSSDYPGLPVAAVIANELRLPGPDPRSVLRCSHKYYARLAQRAAAPEATPRFALIDPHDLSEAPSELTFPCFVKPVKGNFSQYARRIETFEDLTRFVRTPGVRRHLTEYVRPFNQLLARCGGFSVDGAHLLAEELLTGRQITLEGFIHAGVMTVVGIVDSVMYENTPSFARFDYPSTISPRVTERMTDVAERVMASAGFSDGLFNIEFTYDESTDALKIVEINPRMCSQFADLMESVNGTNTYEILFALASGHRPPAVRRAGEHGSATSFVFRHFSDATIVSVPDAQQIEAVRRGFPVTALATLYTAGQQLSDVGHEYDGYSYRYAVVNLAGGDHQAVTRDFHAVRTRLPFRLSD